MHPIRIATLLVCLLGIISVFLPWVVIENPNLPDYVSNGLNIAETGFYGLLAIFLLLFTMVVALKGKRRQAPGGLRHFINLLLGMGIVATMVVFLSRFKLKESKFVEELSEAVIDAQTTHYFAEGVYLTLLAGMLLVVVPSALRYLRKPEEAAPKPADGGATKASAADELEQLAKEQQARKDAAK